ncbi:MAG: FUSC family protein, partial [Achromobacter mucicolens]
SLPLNVWTLSVVMMALSFGIETLVVRHYASAVALITPLTIFLAEAPHLGQGYPVDVIEARFVDTALGAFIGVLGAVLLHSQRIRPTLSRWMRAVLPQRGN